MTEEQQESPPQDTPTEAPEATTAEETAAEPAPTATALVDAPDEIPPVQAEVQAAIDAAEGRPRPVISIERFAFYDMAKQSYAVIQTGERRFYGCFMFRKGVIPPESA